MTVQTQRSGVVRLDARVEMVVGLGALLIVAGGLVAAVNAATPFAHGSWLAAYLVLVGGVAQIALGVGRLGLPAPAPSTQHWRLQITGWNVGNAAVATGVLAGSTVVVVAGSVPLLLTLGGFAAGTPAAWSHAPRRTLAYDAFALMLAISVVIGCVLADAAPTGLT